MGVGDLEHRLRAAAVEAGHEDAGRHAELVHHAEQGVDAHPGAAVAAEIAGDMGVLRLPEELLPPTAR